MESLPALAGTGGLSAASALNPATAALGLAQPLFQGIMGIVQNARANKILKNAERPTAVVPQALIESQRMFNNRVMSGMMPGQQFFADQIAGNQAAAMRNATNMGGSAQNRIGTMLASQALADNSYANLNAQSAQYQMQQQQALANVLGQVANSQQDAWQYNEADPYAALVAAAQREKDAANKNIYGAIGSAGGAIASGITQRETPEQAQTFATNMQKATAQSVIDAFKNPITSKDGQKSPNYQGAAMNQYGTLGQNYSQGLTPFTPGRTIPAQPIYRPNF
jgi:hypothetical protein